MADGKKSKRTVSAVVTGLPREVAQVAGTTAAKKKPVVAAESKVQTAKSRIIARLKRVHPMD